MNAIAMRLHVEGKGIVNFGIHIECFDALFVGVLRGCAFSTFSRFAQIKLFLNTTYNISKLFPEHFDGAGLSEV